MHRRSSGVTPSTISIRGCGTAADGSRGTLATTGPSLADDRPVTRPGDHTAAPGGHRPSARKVPAMSSAPLSSIARHLAAALEPVVGQVYFSPECHAAYAALGFKPSPGDVNGVAMPDGAAYFTSRGSLLGQVPGQVVAAAFGVFNPAVVVPSVTYGWTLTDARTICAARDEGAIAQLRRILGDEPPGLHRAVQLLLLAVEPLRPEGKPLFAGLLAPDARAAARGGLAPGRSPA